MSVSRLRRMSTEALKRVVPEPFLADELLRWKEENQGGAGRGRGAAPVAVAPPIHARQGVLKCSDLVIGKKLGNGAFGVVYEGCWFRAPVAVKILRKEENKDQLEEVLREAKMLQNAAHPYVVTCYGVGTDSFILSHYLTNNSYPL